MNSNKKAFFEAMTNFLQNNEFGKFITANINNIKDFIEKGDIESFTNLLETSLKGKIPPQVVTALSTIIQTFDIIKDGQLSPEEMQELKDKMDKTLETIKNDPDIKKFFEDNPEFKKLFDDLAQDYGGNLKDKIAKLAQEGVKIVASVVDKAKDLFQDILASNKDEIAQTKSDNQEKDKGPQMGG
jgi:hypothetical protein